jgi:hypothetical protein
VAEQNRFFINAYGTDDDALKIALVWLAAEAKRRQLPAVIVVYQKDQGLALGRVVGEAQAKALTAGQTVKLNDVDLSIVPMRKLGPMSLVKSVALAVWLPDKELAKVDDAKPAAMGMVPWTDEDGQTWIASWKPIDMRTMQQKAGGSDLNPVVAEGLRGIAAKSLSHPSDHDRAIETFERLRAAGESFAGRSVRAWAVQHGWSAQGADELAEIADAVKKGNRLRRNTPGRVMLKDEVVNLWRQRVKDGQNPT